MGYNAFFMVQASLERVRGRIQQACQRVKRDPDSVSLVCVTKGVSPERIEEALACGVGDIGENRVQEALSKHPKVRSGIRWHLIGHLQRNKAKSAVEIFDVIHSIDSLEIIQALDRAFALRPACGLAQGERPLEVLVEVNVSAEATKYGCKPEEVELLAQALLACKQLHFSGLMTMAPYSQDPESSRPFFRRLREIRDQLGRRFSVEPLHLSMGMSQDLEVAVEEGATFVRVGTAIFGEITSPPPGSP